VVDTPSSLPSFTSSASFPFEGHLRVKRLDPPVTAEPAREGEEPASCASCNAPDSAYIWVSDRWRVRTTESPSGLPMVLILESRSHLDLGDLPNLLAAELGVMTVRLERAIRSLDGVAQVHVNRWGDGPAHLHLWFLARPVGRLQLRGSFLSMWYEILEPVPEAKWREDLAMIAAWLAEFGGRAHAEPPRIEWHAPSTFGDIPIATADSGEAPKPAPKIGPAPDPSMDFIAEIANGKADYDFADAFQEHPKAASNPAAPAAAGQAPAASEKTPRQGVSGGA